MDSCTSLWTARTSRFARRAISQIAIDPWPAMSLRSAHRLGDRVFQHRILAPCVQVARLPRAHHAHAECYSDRRKRPYPSHSLMHYERPEYHPEHDRRFADGGYRCNG